jgi:hypothetical protein
MSAFDVKHQKRVLLFLIVVSLFGIVLLSSFIFYPVSFRDDFEFRNMVVGSAFVAICVLGISAALYPSSCSAVPQFGESNRHHEGTSNLHQGSFRAHHPSCEKYSTHILRIGRLELCATCSGMAVGAAVALVGAILYFFGTFYTGVQSVLFLIGTVGVTLGLLQSALSKSSSGFTRFFASIFFVLGTYLMLINVDEALGSTSVDLFAVGLSVLWIMTKIACSNWDHRRTCSQCSKFCVWKNTH